MYSETHTYTVNLPEPLLIIGFIVFLVFFVATFGMVLLNFRDIRRSHREFDDRWRRRR
jgi:hypothetical protein